MNQIAQLVLLLWLPLVVFLFYILPTRKAVLISYVVAWLALPDAGWALPGLPDYTKMSATVVAVMIGMVCFDQARLLAFRPRWLDVPMLCWCVGPLITGILNDQGVYEGTSAVLSEVERWGVPYLIGRIYLTDRESIRDLALAIAIGGFCYIPLCLLEIRFSPFLARVVYGVNGWDGLRYGGYRPKVFLHHGLELGMWMTNATFLSYVLWSRGIVKSIRNIPFGLLTLTLLLTTILCKSTGSILLLMVGVATFYVVRKTKKAWLIWILIAFSPGYCVVRSFDLWSGAQVVELSNQVFGADRGQSLEYRLDMESKLAKRASERPIMGWGRSNRFQVTSKRGQVMTVPDGFWIIALGTQGWLGLSSMLCIILMPMVLTLRRFPVSTWSDPQVAPIAGIALVLVLMMIDLIINAMLNPIYSVMSGGLMTQLAFHPGVSHTESEDSLRWATDLVGLGRIPEAEAEFRHVIELTSEGQDVEGGTILAKAYDGLGQTLLVAGQHQQAEDALREALLLRDWLATDSQDPDRFRDLAIAREGLARAMAESGRISQAMAERRVAIKIWEILATDHPKNAEYRSHWGNSLNDLAWMLVADPDPGLHDPDRAVILAEEAVEISTDHDAFWNTLGVARYRTCDYPGAIEALERSAIAAPGGQGTAFDHYFLAMCWYQLHHDDVAQEWLERGLAWEARHRPGHPTLERFRQEARSVLAG